MACIAKNTYIFRKCFEMCNILYIEFENMLNLCSLWQKSVCFSDIFSKFASSNLYYIMGIRLNKVLKQLNVSTETVVEYLKSKPGLEPTKEMNPNTKVTDEQYAALLEEFHGDRLVREKANTIFPVTSRKHKPSLRITNEQEIGVKAIDKVDSDSTSQSPHFKKKTYEEKEADRRAKRIEWLSMTRNIQKEDKAGVSNDDNEAGKETQEVQESSQRKTTEEHITKTIQITFSQLRFEDGCITFKTANNSFIFRHLGFSPELNRHKNDPRIKDVTAKIILDYTKGTFDFVDKTTFQKLEEFRAKIDNETFESHIKEVERKKAKEEKDKERKEKKIAKRLIEHRIQFSALRFGNGIISILYKKNRYVYRDHKIRNYENVLGQVYGRLPKARKNAIKTSLVWIVIDVETGTFTFKDFDIHNYINNLKDSFLPERKKTEDRKEIQPQVKTVQRKPAQIVHSMTLGAGNIRFYNGYFLIFHTIKGEVDNAVKPFRVNDADSHEILNLVHNFFEQRFEQMRIMVKYDETKIHEPAKSDLYQLNKYVRTLKRNLDVKGEWWEEVQNARKRTFGQCFGEPTDSVKKKVVKAKNEYLYNLASLQNDRKLIRVYEINHGKEEDAFIFTIGMPNNRCAVIFENASNDASTTTWVFEAKNDNYEACVNLVFDYFTDYTISAKRSSLRDADTNPPYKFKAEDYTFIDHNDLGQWLKKLNKVLERTSAPSDIKFVPGLNIPQSSDTRSGHGDAITTKNLHNELMRKLYDRLCSESGKDNVGTEIHVGAKRIDAVVKGSDFYDLYEVKTALNPFDCVTEALGQLCQYAYLFCRDKIGKMVIAGASEPTKEVEKYLETLRKNHSLQVYYIKV